MIIINTNQIDITNRLIYRSKILYLISDIIWQTYFIVFQVNVIKND
jgi:hypothetical protein